MAVRQFEVDIHMPMYVYEYVYISTHMQMYTSDLQIYVYTYADIKVRTCTYIYMLPPPPQRSTKINAIRDILGYFHPHSSDHDDSHRWWTCEDMYISWFHSDVSDGSVKQ